MYDKTEFRILEHIYTNKSTHKRGLAKQLGVTMPSIDYAIKKIQHVLKQKKVGNQIHYSLDYTKEELTPLITIIEHKRLQELPAKTQLSINDFLQEIEEKPLMTILFGSTANNTYTKNSDIDVLLVFQKVPKNIEHTAKKISLKTNTQLNPVYLTYQEFKESFHNTTKLFFKKIREEKILITGVEWWRQLINEEA